MLAEGSEWESLLVSEFKLGLEVKQGLGGNRRVGTELHGYTMMTETNRRTG